MNTELPAFEIEITEIAPPPPFAEPDGPPLVGRISMGDDAEHFSLFQKHLFGVPAGPFIDFQREHGEVVALRVVDRDGNLSQPVRIDAEEFHRLYAIAKMLRL